MIRQTFALREEEARSTRNLNLARKKMKCLGCGKEIVTDRCHRFCRVCQRRNRRNGHHLPKIGKIGGVTEFNLS